MTISRLILIEAGSGSLAVMGLAAGLLAQSAIRAQRDISGRLDQVAASHRPALSSARLGRPESKGQITKGLITLIGGAGLARSENPQRVLLVAGLLAATVGYAGGKLIGSPGFLLVPTMTVGFCRFWVRRLAVRRSSQLFVQLPDALGIIVRGVRVGVPVSAAITIVADESAEPTATEFRLAGEAIAIGRSLPEALHSMAARTGLTEYRFFATALALQSQTGGALTETLETLADTIRRRVTTRERGYALASEARMSCYILGVLPFALALLMHFINPAYLNILFTTGSGRLMLFAAVTLLTIGIFAMRLITKSALQ